MPCFSVYHDQINEYYIERWRGTHPLFPGQYDIPQHRRVVAERLGRSLSRKEQVPHRDEDGLNNSDSNLELLSETAHKRLHRQGRKHSPEVRLVLSQRAKVRNADPAFNAMLRDRAKRQWSQGNIGRPPRQRPA